MTERRLQAWALGLLGLMVAVSLLISPDLGLSALAVAPLLLGLALYLLASFWPALMGRPDWLALGLALTLAGVAALAPFGMLEPRHTLFRLIPPLSWLRQHAPISLNANVVAGTLVVLLPVAPALVLWPTEPQPRRRWVWVLAVLSGALGVGVLYLTHSQAGILAFAVELALLGALRWPRAARWFTPLLLAAGVALGSVLGWRQVLDQLAGSGTMEKFDGRIEIWGRALLLIGDHPFTGVGFGCFAPVVREVYPLFLLPHATVTSAHNLALQVAADLGLPGLAAYLVLLGHALWSAGGSWRASPSDARWHKVLSATCLAALAGLTVHGLLDAAQWANKLMFLPWAIMGLAVGLGRREQKR
jgi:putative inorganic carbon (HCO3(-)) transporter